MAARCRPGMLCGMQEIGRVLAAHPPFDGLPSEALEQTAATVEIAYFPRGASILRQGGEPSRHLHVIAKGRSGSSRCCRGLRICGTWSPARMS